MTLHLPDRYRLQQDRSGALVDPNAARVHPAVDFTTAGYEEYLRITRASYFLLKLRGVDMASHCRKCGAGKPGIPAHEYFTLFCIERPWKGNWLDALWAYSSVTRDPAQQSMLVRGLRDLSQSHPGYASQLVSQAAQDVVAFAVSSEEPIEEWKALELAKRINEYGSQGYGWVPFRLE